MIIPIGRTRFTILVSLLLVGLNFALSSPASAFTKEDWKDFWGESDDMDDDEKKMRKWGPSENYNLYIGVELGRFQWDKPGTLRRDDEEFFNTLLPPGTSEFQTSDDGTGVSLVLGGEWRIPEFSTDGSNFFIGLRGTLGTLPSMSASSNHVFDINTGNGTERRRVSIVHELDADSQLGIEVNARWQFPNRFSAGAFVGYNRYHIDRISTADIQVLNPSGEFVTFDSVTDRENINDGAINIGVSAGYSFGGNTPQDPNPWYLRIKAGMTEVNNDDMTFVTIAIEKTLGGYNHKGIGP